MTTNISDTVVWMIGPSHTDRLCDRKFMKLLFWM